MPQHYYCRQRFYALALKYCSIADKVDSLWDELVLHYSEEGRYYHTINHISGLIAVLETMLSYAECADALFFAAFYHDVIYDVQKDDNEERSAEFARERLEKTDVPPEVAELCCVHILATKRHEIAACADTNLFTDADLAILGATESLYMEYCTNIRRENSIYPDIVYRAERKRVLERFLAMEFIYKTASFRERYETQARKNIAFELAGLLQGG